MLCCLVLCVMCVKVRARHRAYHPKSRPAPSSPVHRPALGHSAPTSTCATSVRSAMHDLIRESPGRPLTVAHSLNSGSGPLSAALRRRPSPCCQRAAAIVSGALPSLRARLWAPGRTEYGPPLPNNRELSVPFPFSAHTFLTLPFPCLWVIVIRTCALVMGAKSGWQRRW
ncbi:hypothetical protein EDB80DRAFT_725124 [Ilyonectria destructans]|nr:hypothetical protein EDB80DRAFT_725124 [Ilyonectria destructans]